MRNNFEAIEQIKLFNWAELMKSQYPELKLLFHIPNGGSRNKLEAANLKRQGVKSGVPDLCLPVARGDCHGLYIEMKYGKNRTSKAQKEWLAALEEQRYYTAVCYSYEEAAKLIVKYLSQKPIRCGNFRFEMDGDFLKVIKEEREK